MIDETNRTVVIGAGPYGLSVTAHLREAGVDTKVFGDTMDFWQEQMPKGMLLRSSKRASSLSDPKRRFTLDAFARDTGSPIDAPIELERFIAYGQWFQRQVAPDVDPRRVTDVQSTGSGFRVVLDDGGEELADNVVVAAGLSTFPRVPDEFASIPDTHVSHACEHDDLSKFVDRRVAVIGLGQSALESAALLKEAGAEVEVIGRSHSINWLPDPPVGLQRFRMRFYPPTDVGGIFNGWLAAVPDAFRRAPASKQPIWAYNAIRPAGAYWLRPRLADGVQISTGCSVVGARANGKGIRMTLSDGSERHVDHALLATGYQIDVAKYPFLGPELLSRLQRANGYPVLRPGLESSIGGLYFAGASAAISFGPITRFVVGATYAAPAVARSVARRRQRVLSFAF
jgi:thioredoxin reductase